MRATLLASLLSAIVSVSAQTTAQASFRVNTDIPPEDLATALHTLVKDRDLQIICSFELLAQHNTLGARGHLTIEEALRQILRGTGLTYRFLDERTVTIVPLVRASDPSGSSTTQSHLPPAQPQKPTTQRG